MKIAMIGTGYVGLVSGACFSEFGFTVTCVDQDADKIARLERGEIPIYEPGLDRVVEMNRSEGRLHFTTDLATAVANANVVFVAVGTPSRRGDGEADLEYVYEAARQIARAAQPGAVIVIKSTVVVGTTRDVRRIIADERPDLDFSIAMNPEFLREGSAIEDFMRPDRVVIGVEDERGETALRRLYRPLNLRDTPIVVTSLEDAELAKYASNAFLAMKVTFINEVANLCEQVGGNVQDVARAMGLDNRIGSKFLHAGPGFGGSCFPKDTRAYAATGRRYAAPQGLIEAVVEINDTRRADMARRILARLGDSPAGKTVGLLGIAFKPNTDDIREAPSLDIIPILQQAGVAVRAHDPAAMAAAQQHFDDVVWAESPLDVADGAHAVAILTEWNAYRALDLTDMAARMANPVLLDLRNIYKADDISGSGLAYHSIGRPTIDRQASHRTPHPVEDAAE